MTTTKHSNTAQLIFCLLLVIDGVLSQAGKGAASFEGPPLVTWFDGSEQPDKVEADDIAKWQSYLDNADATGTFILPGFNLSQPWSDADPLNWTVKIAVKADMRSPHPSSSNGDDFITGGSVWIEPPDGLVTKGSNYTANPEWYPYLIYYSTRGLFGPGMDAPLTPFFHRSPDDADRRADGSCDGILPPECIESLVDQEVARGDLFRPRSRSPEFIDRDVCLGIGWPWPGGMGSPLNLMARQGKDAAMPFDGGWVLSFSSELGPRGNATDYARHGSQYVPVLFHWMRDVEQGTTYSPDDPEPNGQRVHLMCLAVNEAAKGKLLPDPGEAYLKEVQPAEDELRGSANRLALSLALVGISIGLSTFIN